MLFFSADATQYRTHYTKCLSCILLLWWCLFIFENSKATKCSTIQAWGFKYREKEHSWRCIFQKHEGITKITYNLCAPWISIWDKMLSSTSWLCSLHNARIQWNDNARDITIENCSNETFPLVVNTDLSAIIAR